MACMGCISLFSFFHYAYGCHQLSEKNTDIILGQGHRRKYNLRWNLY